MWSKHVFSLTCFGNKWLGLPRKSLPWQQFHVIALAKLQGTENSFTGMLGPIVSCPAVHLHGLQTFIFQVTATLGQQLWLRNTGTMRCSLTPEWLCMCVSVWWTRTDLITFTSHSCWCCHFCVLLRDNINSEELPCRASLVQKLLGLVVGLMNNCLIRDWRLWPISSQFPGLELLSSQCLVLEQG